MPAQETVCIHTIELLIYRKNPLLLWGDMKKKGKFANFSPIRPPVNNERSLIAMTVIGTVGIISVLIADCLIVINNYSLKSR